MSEKSGDKNEFATALEKYLQKMISLGQNICCVCHHELEFHISEGDFWRCHTLGPDGYQCECILRRNRADNKISYYDLLIRVNEHIKELKEEMKKFL